MSVPLFLGARQLKSKLRGTRGTLSSVRPVLLLPFIAACGALPFEPAGPDHAPDPSALGPYPVGVRTETFYDPVRDRTLVTEIWYPADTAGPGYDYPLVDLVPEEVRGEVGDLGTLPTDAVRDAKLAAGRFPLVVFSHGNAGVRMQSTYLTVALASHGYVVASADHAGNTLGDAALLERPEGALLFDLEAVLTSYLERPRDVSAVIDRLEGLDLAEAIDFDRVGVAGHSFGAVTALRVAAMDPRIDAAVSQAPAGYELSWFEMETDLDEVTAPVMLQAGGIDRLNPDDPVVDSVWSHVTAPGWYVHFPRAGHFTFSDFCKVDPEAIEQATQAGLGDILDDGCGPMNLPPEEAYALIDRFTIGFFNVHLRDSSGSTRYLEPTEETRVDVR